MVGSHTGLLQALLAALLFGASVPLAKWLIGDVHPLLMAGLLYAGSGAGLTLYLAGRFAVRGARRNDEAKLSNRDLPWLAGAVLFGGALGPALLMFGLQHSEASTASLLLNLESVLTAVLAWWVFREHTDRRIVLGMLAIVGGGILLSLGGTTGWAPSWGSLLISGACLCWAIDNNLTRAISAADPVVITTIKGGVAGTANIALALSLGQSLPGANMIAWAAVVGLFGYGISLVMFVLALRHLGTARTGAYFSVSPFVGASIALLWLGESPSLYWWLAAGLMGIGVWLHVSERHDHEHTHEAMAHSHRHVHDEHHQHEHDFDWDGHEPHSHFHQHQPLTHSHPHYPDLHHRHRH